jgi:phenylalanyl-tRNA synthetase beta chain
VAAAFDIDRSVYIFELDFETLAELWARRPLGYRPLPKFPPLERDLALVLPEATGMAEVVEQIRLAEPVLVEQVDLFDCYRGDQIPAGHKSLAFTIRLRSAEETLTDRQADQVVEAVVRRLAQAFGATLR